VKGGRETEIEGGGVGSVSNLCLASIILPRYLGEGEEEIPLLER
jgi:hypothetical protein